MNLKQLFCKHQWTRISSQPIFTRREKSGATVIGLPIYVTYNYFKDVYKCFRCNKTREEMKRFPAHNHQASVLY